MYCLFLLARQADYSVVAPTSGIAISCQYSHRPLKLFEGSYSMYAFSG